MTYIEGELKVTFVKYATAILVALMLAGIPTAMAGSPAKYFEKMDADANGSVSEAEFVSFKTAGGKYSEDKARAKFAKLAGDDGLMTLGEFESAMKASHKDKKKERSTDQT